MLAIVLHTTDVAVADGNELDAGEIGRRALLQRDALHSGEVEYLSTLRLFRNKGEKVIVIKGLAYFDGAIVRFDRSDHPGESPDDGHEAHVTRVVVGPSETIKYTEVASKDTRASMGVHIDRSELADRRSRMAVDPRNLGMTPTGFSALHIAQFGRFIAHSERTNVKSNRDSVDGREVWRVDYERLSDGALASFWVDPERDYSVVRAHVKSRHPDGTTTDDSIECSLKQWPEGNVWYPERVLHQLRVDGRLSHEEETQVVRARFNTEVHPDAFSLSGMDVIAGSQVFEIPTPPGASRMWDGKELVPIKGRERLAGWPPQHTRRGWLYVSLGLALGAAACIALYVWCRTRR
jgi:hypothetical protein